MKKIIISTGIMLVIALSSAAQIEGNISDTAGEAIPNAMIIAIDSTKNTVDTIRSDKIGYFTYKNLKRGKYKITISAAGFQHAVYENIIVKNETPDDDKTGADISNAIWLEMVLKPAKVPE